MFTLRILGNKDLQPKVYHLHAASLGSSVLRDKNTLEARFQQAIIPEDQLTEDAAVRTLMAQNHGSDIEITKLLSSFRGLRTATHTTPPAVGARGNMDDVQNRLTPDNISLSTLQAAYNELVETGWTGDVLDQFGVTLNKAYAKIPGLKKVKQAYMGLDIAINRFNNVADRHEAITVLSPSEVEAFNTELQRVTGKTIEQILTEVGKGEENVLEGKLSEIKSLASYRALRDQAGFDRQFLSYFSQRLLRKANRDLEVTKESEFKDRRAEFEGLVNQSRKAAQEYILSLDPTNADELERLHQVFVTNRRYFELTGRRGAHAPALDWDREMTRRVHAIMERYYPDMVRGYERPAIVSRIPGMSSPARTVDTLVGAVMSQSTAENQLYYSSENPMRRPEELTTGQATVKMLGKAGETLGSFFRSPTTQKWVQGFMSTTKKAVETTVGYAGNLIGTTANVVGDKVIAKTTGFINEKMGKVDGWAWEKRGEGFLKTLGWMAKLPARPVTKLGKLLTWSTDGVIGKGVGNIAISKGVNAILAGGKNAYKATNDVVATLPDDEVKDAFSGLGWLVRKAGEWTGKGVEWVGQSAFESAKTTEMRGILSSLRAGLDEAGHAGMQAAQFRSVMGRNWGTGTPHADNPTPEAPVVAATTTPATTATTTTTAATTTTPTAPASSSTTARRVPAKRRKAGKRRR